MKNFFRVINVPLLGYIFIVFIGLVAHYAGFVWLEEFYEALDVAAAVALAFFALWGYMEYNKQEESIEIYFQVAEQKKKTGLTLLRKNCTRSELLGVLGMIQKDPKTRFEIASMKKVKFLDTLARIQKESAKELYIMLTEKELEQFETED